MTKLADLGIATASDGTRITRSGIVLGTAAYMAPEQLDGREIGPPADIYALAAIAFEALSGRKPREGRTPMEIAHRMANDGPPDLSEAWPRAPRAAVDVLKRGMAFDPEDRPASAGALARELAEALDQAQAPPTRPTRRLRRSAAAPVAASAAPAARAARGTRRRHQRRAVHAHGRSSAPHLAAARTPSGHARSDPRHRVHRARGGRDHRRRERRRRQQLLAGREADAAGSEQRGHHQQERTGEEEERAEAEREAERVRAGAGARQGDGQIRRGARRRAQQPGLRADEPGRLQAGGPDPPAGRRLVPARHDATSTTRTRSSTSASHCGSPGSPDKAIPILEQRLEIPNQTETVQHELDLAKQQAGQG